MKKIKILAAVLAALTCLASCSTVTDTDTDTDADKGANGKASLPDGTVEIVLSDGTVTFDGTVATDDTTSAVYVANDIVYYEADKGFTYGAGSAADEHTAQEADGHTVVHITKAGTYALSGSLSAGQIAIDLGDGAKKDPDAVVTLILNGVDITCTVAPAVIFYNVYECGDDDEEKATANVDTSAAGANVIIADGTVNNIYGSYVARIYKPESVVLSDDGLSVESQKKLHKYDGAFYSKRSMNINGGSVGDGVLNITAENEGLDSELHLTVNGGIINIFAGNDGINTNEDNVSVTTVNGGTLNITVTGETGEGDGIDSNGWLVINGGTVISCACSNSMDSGIDSDMGIYINGGTVIATGNMYDAVDGGDQNYAVFSFSERQRAGDTIVFQNENGDKVLDFTLPCDCTVLVLSTPELTAGTYALTVNGSVASHGGASFGMGGFGMGGFGMGGAGAFKPDGMDFDGEMPELPDGMQKPDGTDFDGEMPELPDGMQKPDGTDFDGEMPELPDGMQKPDGMDFDGEMPELPDGMQKPDGMDFDGEMPELPDGMQKPDGMNFDGEVSSEFEITDGANTFSGITIEK